MSGDTIVRMGDLAVSADAAATLVTIGLGSCIGLVLVDRIRAVAGLAHVMLPAARPGQPAPQPGKYADLAVPALVEGMLGAGARRSALEVALVGGAQMFGGATGLDVGARNEAAVRDALAAERLRVKVAATGGDKGRTVRVGVGGGNVLVRMANRADEVLMEANA